jgi:plastocyanin
VGAGGKGRRSRKGKVAARPIPRVAGARSLVMKSSMILFSAALLLTGCSASPAPKADARATAHAVTIQGIAFAPSKLSVPVGTRVTWTDKDNVKHTVTSGKPGKDAIPGVRQGTAAHPSGVFDHPMSPSGGTFNFTFKKAGTYAYFCRIHSSMRGVIVVR